MPWARPGDRCPVGAGGSLRNVRGDRHRPLPVFPVSISNDQCDRAADRLPGAHAADDVRTIGFDGHAAATAVPALPPRKLGRDSLRADAKTSGKTVEDGDERLAV